MVAFNAQSRRMALVLTYLLTSAACGRERSEADVGQLLHAYAPGFQMGMRADSARVRLKSAESWYIDGPGYRDSSWHGPRGYDDVILRFEEDDELRSARPDPTFESDTPQPPPSSSARLVEVRLVPRNVESVIAATQRDLTDALGPAVEWCAVIGDGRDRILRWGAGERLIMLRLRDRTARSGTNYGQDADLRFYASSEDAAPYIRSLRRESCGVG
jgi:hypothetical protein